MSLAIRFFWNQNMTIHSYFRRSTLLKKHHTHTRELEIRSYKDFTVMKKQERVVICGEGFSDDPYCLFLLPMKKY